MRSPRKLSVHCEQWVSKAKFHIAGWSWDRFEVVHVELTDGEHVGRGEAAPVFYLGETVATLYAAIESVAVEIESGIDREALRDLMPPGGARKALDCALWDFEAKCAGVSVWELAGIQPRTVETVFTIGIEPSLEAVAARAREAHRYSSIKIAVDGDRPVERVAAIRAVRPDATVLVDANQAWSFEQLKEFAPQLQELGVSLIEQPLPRGKDDALESYRAPLPLCADESCQHLGDLAQTARRYQLVNVKLEKAGGLTEALVLARAAQAQGLVPLTGCMWGTSLAMAPSMVLAQLCKYVELNGQLLLKYDRLPALVCRDGIIEVPDRRLWG